jgi:3-phytase
MASGAVSVDASATPRASQPTATPAVIPSVGASVETPALFDDAAGGDANGDDPAIWVHPSNPAASLVIVTKKNAGLSVYDLAGVELQAIAPPAAPRPDDSPGRFNNVDLLLGFELGGRRVDLAVVTDRGRDQIRFYTIDASAAAAHLAPLTDVTAASVPFVFSADQTEANDQANAYGLAVKGARGRDPSAIFASRRHRTEVAELEPVATSDGHVTYRRLGIITVPREFTLPNGAIWTPCSQSDEELPQVEGMVVDVEQNVLYMAQEDVGIWALPLANQQHHLRLVDKVREFGVPYDRIFNPEEEEFSCALRFSQNPGYGGQHLSADAEGLTVYYGRGNGQKGGYLLASSQGDSTYAVYERSGMNAFVGSFRVGNAGNIDGAEHSDGAAVVNVPLGSAFPLGLFVTHDGENTPVAIDSSGETRENTNFKLVPWEDIANVFPRPLLIDTQSKTCLGGTQ